MGGIGRRITAPPPIYVSPYRRIAISLYRRIDVADRPILADLKALISAKLHH